MSVAQSAVDFATATPAQIAAAVPAPDLPAAIAAVTPHLRPPASNAAATIDQFTGVPVSGAVTVEISAGATVYGPVAGVNNGTQVMVNGQVGTLLNLAQALEVRRLPASPGPPAAVLSFLDREHESGAIRRLLRERSAVWLYGPPGCGLTAVASYVVNFPEATQSPDGVLYLNGASVPSSIDDLVQSIFSRFFGGGARVDVGGGSMPRHIDIHVSPDEARTHLGTLRAIFAWDDLPFEPSELRQLRDVLGRSTVIATAGVGGPETFVELPLAGLPDGDARAFFARIAGPAANAADVAAVVDRLCPALDCLPLALRLAGRLIRHEVFALPALAAKLEQQSDGRDAVVAAQRARRRPRPDAPLSAIARVLLDSLTDVELAVLDVLVRGGDGSATLSMLAGAGNVAEPDADDALQWLGQLGVIERGERRYRLVSASLRRVLERLLPPSDARKRIAAFLALVVPQHATDLGWLAAERGNLGAAIQTLLANGEAEQAGRLIRALQPSLVLGGAWDAWAQNSAQALEAASVGGNPSLRAWALHERGTRAGLLDDMGRADADLREASRLRAEQGDRAGAAASEHNLRYLGLRLLPPPPPSPSTRPPVNPRVLLTLLAVVLVAVLSMFAGPPIVRAIRGPVPTPAPSVLAATATATASPAPTVTASPTLLPTVTSTALPTATGEPTPLPPAVPSFADTELRAGESEAQVAIRIVLSTASAGDMTLLVSARDGSATAGSDYTPISESVTFAPGELEKIVSVPILGDLAFEGDETVLLSLGGQGIEPGMAGQSAILTIVDDDPVPTLTPTGLPTLTPTGEPTVTPTVEPTLTPTEQPTLTPTDEPTLTPTDEPTLTPTEVPTLTPTEQPTLTPTDEPTLTPTDEPTLTPTDEPTITPTPDSVSPAVPELREPQDGATISTGSCEEVVTLRWTVVDDPSGVTYSWMVEEEQSETFALFSSGVVAENEVTVAVGCGNYRWSVQAVDGAGNASRYADWHFFYVTVPAL